MKPHIVACTTITQYTLLPTNKGLLDVARKGWSEANEGHIYAIITIT